MANIKKDEKTGTYYFKISLGTDPITGKRRQTTRRGFKKKSDATKVYNELKNQYYGGSLIYNRSILFGDFFEDYLKWYKTRVKESTYENRIKTIDKNILLYFRNFKIDQITPIVINNWQNELIDRGLKPNYIRGLHATLSQILERALKLELISSNPAKKAGNVKKEKQEVDFWTEEELVQFCSVLDRTELLQDFAFIIINFLFYTGLRFSEMQALQWKDLDSQQKCVNISKDLYYRTSENWTFDDLKNKQSKRSVTLDNITYQMLLDWKNRQQTLYKINEESFIFSFNTLPTNKHFPYNYITRFAPLANIKRIKTHALRHSHASYLIQLDVNIIAIARRLGHKDVQEVLKTYGHLYPQYQFDVVSNINDHRRKQEK
ncbi:site-specific integrase [Turicibacter sanguinis]|uniref:site-specific integrase n=1 Tax=Turicibacter sanguinis TaxID=154288 RepID=UPI0021D497F9|nr:site-specific integrase [Turicibacter sanguinis]MCU7195874.1 site-specific integrase [Turicibacter sanguinis]